MRDTIGSAGEDQPVLLMSADKHADLGVNDHQSRPQKRMKDHVFGESHVQYITNGERLVTYCTGFRHRAGMLFLRA